MSPRERLFDWFRNEFEHQQFELSMNPDRIALAGMRSVMAFLAQGVALIAYEDRAYLGRLVNTHRKLTAMAEEYFARDETAHPHYWFALIAGMVAEVSMNAVGHLMAQDGT